MTGNPHLPRTAVLLEKIEEAPTVMTFRLGLDGDSPAPFDFRPGQFNMVGVFGVGEVPLSIVSDPLDIASFDHTVRIVGRVTGAMARLRPGDRLTVRGPFGNGWPLEESRGRDLVLISGGLGCAPLVSVVNYVLRRRESFGRLTVLHGVKHPADLFWKDRFDRLNDLSRTRAYVTSDIGGPGWEGGVGPVTDLIDRLPLTSDTSVKICGPEPMMLGAIGKLLRQGVREEDLWISMERNMQCAAGFCGHCLLSALFICRDGPVFRYSAIRPYLGIRGL